MDWIFNKIDYKWIGLEQKWIGSRKLDFLPTLNKNHISKFCSRNPFPDVMV